MATRITDFRHIVPVSKMDVTVGTRAPRIAEVDRTARVPRNGDVRPLGIDTGVPPPANTEFRPPIPSKGFVVDVFA
jgi:hypothetical protein